MSREIDERVSFESLEENKKITCAMRQETCHEFADATAQHASQSGWLQAGFGCSHGQKDRARMTP
jgi:hypothetical protein